MDLLSFARGPALEVALVIFLFGVFWRLAGVLLLRHKPDYSEPRNTNLWWGAVRTVFTRMWPKREFWPAITFPYVLSYTFHIGLFIIVFFFVPHIMFIRDITGLSWPGLPNNLVYGIGGLTLAAMVAVFVRRLGHPVLRLLSNFDDYFSWLVAALPVLTGLLAAGHLWVRYENLLAFHILSVELLLIWFPFGKLMHATLFAISRGTTGALFERKGAGT